MWPGAVVRLLIAQTLQRALVVEVFHHRVCSEPPVQSSFAVCSAADAGDYVASQETMKASMESSFGGWHWVFRPGWLFHQECLFGDPLLRLAGSPLSFLMSACRLKHPPCSPSSCRHSMQLGCLHARGIHFV